MSNNFGQGTRNPRPTPEALLGVGSWTKDTSTGFSANSTTMPKQGPSVSSLIGDKKTEHSPMMQAFLNEPSKSQPWSNLNKGGH